MVTCRPAWMKGRQLSHPLCPVTGLLDRPQGSPCRSSASVGFPWLVPSLCQWLLLAPWAAPFLLPEQWGNEWLFKSLKLFKDLPLPAATACKLFLAEFRGAAFLGQAMEGAAGRRGQEHPTRSPGTSTSVLGRKLEYVLHFVFEGKSITETWVWLCFLFIKF